MAARKLDKTPRTRKQRKTFPLHIRRCGLIYKRGYAVWEEVSSILKGPCTRSRFKYDIENILEDAAVAFWGFLYATTNGKRVEAAECWDEAQGIVEYQLPMGLLHPARNLKRQKSREKAIEEVLRIIEAEIPNYRKQAEYRYTKWKLIRFKKPLKRPDESRFQEFLPWVKYVMETTLETEESVLSWRARKQRKGAKVCRRRS